MIYKCFVRFIVIAVTEAKHKSEFKFMASSVNKGLALDRLHRLLLKSKYFIQEEALVVSCGLPQLWSRNMRVNLPWLISGYVANPPAEWYSSWFQ